MFTGLVEEVGTVCRLVRRGDYQRMVVAAHTVLSDTRVGDSIALDGVCQTVTRLHADAFEVETLAVSLAKTTMGSWRSGRRVNLERSLTPSSRLGGHFVQGHVDARARIVDLRREGENGYMTVALSGELATGCVAEGSIAIDGVSLTIAVLADRAEQADTHATVNIIPHTWNHTALGDRRVGDEVNIEVDILGRYVARLVSVHRSHASTGTHRPLTTQSLTAWGYA